MGFKRPEVQIFSPRPAIIYVVYYEIGRSGHPLRSFFAVFHPKTPGIRLHFPKIRLQPSLQGYTASMQGYSTLSTVSVFNCRIYVTISVSTKSDGFLSAR